MRKLRIAILGLLLAAPVWANNAGPDLRGTASGGGGSGTVTNVSGGNGLTGTNPTTTPVISLPACTAAQMLLENAGATAFTCDTLSGAGDLGTTSLGATGVLNAQVVGLSHVTSQTNHAVQIGATTGINNVAVGATGTVLAGSTSADPSFTASPAVTSIATGTSPPTCAPGTAGVFCANEGTAPTAAASVGDLYADSTSHFWKTNNNNAGAEFMLTAATEGGAAGTFLYGNGSTAIPIWSTLTMPNAATQGDILVATGANAIGSVADVAVGKVLASGGTSTVPAYSAVPVLGVAASVPGTIGLAKGVGGGNIWTLASAATSAWTMTGAATAPAQGDLLDFSNGTGQMASVADVAVGQVLVSGGVGAAPSYNGTAPGTSGMALKMTTAGVGSWSATSDTLTVNGLLGALASTAGATLLEGCKKMALAGHVVHLTCTDDFLTACTTAPSFSTRDVTSTTNGTGTVACGNTAGTAVQTAPGLSFAAGDQVCITRTVNGGTCTVPFFSVQADIAYP